MARKRIIIPDLYFPDDHELQASHVEGEGGSDRRERLEGGETVDLTPEGFIPVHKLTLGDLPEPIRTEKHLKYILAVSKKVVRINNNGLSDKRPDDDEFKRGKYRTLCGSGFIHSEVKNRAAITTNRHVLFNEEELLKSTFDVFYDYHQRDPEDSKKLFKRSARTNGKYFLGKFSKDDIAHGVFAVKDAMSAHIREHCPRDEILKRSLQLIQLPEFDGDPSKPPIACLISHPLGQPKHVSFGEMDDYNLQSKTVYHTAPSKPGSSGGRVIVFSRPLITSTIFHVGTDLETGKKYARVQAIELSPLDVADFMNVDLSEGRREELLKEKKTTFEELAWKASASLEIASLAAFAPIFGAFLLHIAENHFAGLDLRALKPCKTFLTDGSFISYDQKQSAKAVIQKLAQVAPSFPLCPSGNLHDTPDLVSLLESQGPCFCRSIVKVMERGIKLDDGTVTECYISPFTAAANMSTDKDITWPWLYGNSSDFMKDDAPEDCLLKKCLELAEGDIIPNMLVLMIAKANGEVKEMCLQSGIESVTLTSEDNESQGDIAHMRTAHVLPCKHREDGLTGTTRDSLPPARKKKLDSSMTEKGTDWQRLTEDVLLFLQVVRAHTAPRFATKVINKHQGVVSQHREKEDLKTLFSKCTALSEHSFQHEQQIHPDTQRDGREDGKEIRCHCGRPGSQEPGMASDSLVCFGLSHVVGDSHPYTNNFKKVEDIVLELQEKSTRISVRHFMEFFLNLQGVALNMSLCPENIILTTFDKVDAFPHGRHSLMHFLASGEAFLYNDSLLVKHVSKQLQPLYFAFPVSVFGRPGNWPGNATPPEVQCTAWRLLEAAIRASGFPPAVLAALRNDTERREKLIDLYVDMKQLKWQGRIQPCQFAMYLCVAIGEMLNHLQVPLPFENSTHYFVWYAAFLVCPKILSI